MSKMFTFAYAGKNEILDNLVASFSELVDMRSKKDFVKNDEYNKKNALFNEALIKYCCEESGREFEGVDMVKDPMVVGRTSFKEAFDTVNEQSEKVSSNEKTFSVDTELQKINAQKAYAK